VVFEFSSPRTLLGNGRTDDSMLWGAGHALGCTGYARTTALDAMYAVGRWAYCGALDRAGYARDKSPADLQHAWVHVVVRF
jgi:hypothetical protein